MKRSLNILAASAVVALALVAGSADGATPRPGAGGCIAASALGAQPGLSATAAAGGADAWAVGVRGHAFLTEHLFGGSWIRGAAPVPHGSWNAADQLTGVTDHSPLDTWLVGSYCGATGTKALQEQWKGGSWHLTTSPLTAHDSVLNGVAVVPKTSFVWAVGEYGASNNFPTGFRTLVELWTGREWIVAPSPSFGSLTTTGDVLSGVAASGSQNAWAVGHFGSSPLVLHWGGHHWTRSALPLSYAVGSLYGVSTTAPNDAWAVGVELEGQDVPVVLHWNGTAWSFVTTGAPTCGGTYNANYGVAARSTSNVWVVGWCQGAFSLHWNGMAWSEETTPNASSVTLYGITLPTAAHPVAVGAGCASPTCTSPTDLIERWNGSMWRFQSH